jgi:hypothetical protein
MRTPFAAIAAALLVAATACAASGAGSSKPQLKLVRGSVHGAHFASRELVRLSFVGPAPRAQRRVRSSASGTFAAALPAAADPCLGPLLVVARGASGDSARLKLPRRACPPAAKTPGA